MRSSDTATLRLSLPSGGGQGNLISVCRITFVLLHTDTKLAYEVINGKDRSVPKQSQESADFFSRNKNFEMSSIKYLDIYNFGNLFMWGKYYIY
jgi:hypothetical protein